LLPTCEVRDETKSMAKVGLVQLGCPKNHVDAEEMMGALARESGGSCEFVGNGSDADVIIINTCAFIESAKQESINAILDAVKLKQRGVIKRVVVTGCLAQRYGGELEQEIPEIDAILGVESAKSISNVVFGVLPNYKSQKTDLTEKYPLIPNNRLRTGGTPWTAYLKVSEGCDHRCTFCSIPAFRGRHRSKPIERLIQEAEELVAAGAKELNLVAQDTTAYGMDIYQKLALPELLVALNEIDGLEWIRLLYCYPTMVTDRLMDVWSDVPKLVPYIDMPLQHADDTMLRAMKRGGSVRLYRNLFDRLRSKIPDLTLRTTFIVGFPGETNDHFENLLEFVEDVRFDRLGVFTYSAEDGTPAATIELQVPKRISMARRDELMKRQQAISLSRNRAWLGRNLDVLVEQRRGSDVIGRSQRDAPDIDGSVVISQSNAHLGDIVSTVVTDAEVYDLSAAVVEARQLAAV
jgi:ribosomal protein S12 methylthiotransferase